MSLDSEPECTKNRVQGRERARVDYVWVSLWVYAQGDEPVAVCASQQVQEYTSQCVLLSGVGVHLAVFHIVALEGYKVRLGTQSIFSWNDLAVCFALQPEEGQVDKNGRHAWWCASLQNSLRQCVCEMSIFKVVVNEYHPDSYTNHVQFTRNRLKHVSDAAVESGAFCIASIPDWLRRGVCNVVWWCRKQWWHYKLWWSSTQLQTSQGLSSLLGLDFFQETCARFWRSLVTTPRWPKG